MDDADQGEPTAGSKPDTAAGAGANVTVLDPARFRQSNAARTSLDSIFRSYHRILLKFLSDRLLNKGEVEDVAQEVYYRITRRPDLENVQYPKAFLLRVATNLLIDMNRCRQRQQAEIPLDSELLEEENLSTDTPESHCLGEEMLACMEAALAELSPKCRAVFVMNRIDGITYRQIAKDLNLSQSMVEKYMRQALNHLMNTIEVAQ